MKVTIELPKEFEEHFNIDRFKDSLERIRIDIQCSLECSEVKMAGIYELKLIQMLRDRMLKAEVVKEGELKW